MSDRILIEVLNNNGFKDSDYTRQGYFIAVTNGSGYDGGGYKTHSGLWMVLSDAKTGAIFQEPIHRCREVIEARAAA